jgi:predicted TIM-barrel fold metal-dependent hydrolase
MDRNPNIKYILSHAGGTIPYLPFRMEMSRVGIHGLAANAHHDIEYYLQQLYYDTALSTHPATLSALTRVAAPGHVLYGSDWPMVPEAAVVAENKLLDASPVLDAAMSQAIERGNAEVLFPRFAKVNAAAA